MKAHYIILENQVVLSAKPYASWRDIQDEYPDYVASLGPWTQTELLDYLQDDFKEEANWPLTRTYINKFYSA